EQMHVRRGHVHDAGNDLVVVDRLPDLELRVPSQDIGQETVVIGMEVLDDEDRGLQVTGKATRDGVQRLDAAARPTDGPHIDGGLLAVDSPWASRMDGGTMHRHAEPDAQAASASGDSVRAAGLYHSGTGPATAVNHVTSGSPSCPLKGSMFLAAERQGRRWCGASQAALASPRSHPRDRPPS